ncbi:MAG: M23 family metallopeptidase [Bacillota bacterium]
MQGFGPGAKGSPLAALLILAAAAATPGCARGKPPAAPPSPPTVTSPAPSAGGFPAPPPTTPPVPAPEVILEPAEVPQGRWLVVRVLGTSGPVTGELAEFGPLHFFRQGGEFRALAAVPAAATPGPRPVTVRWPGGEWQGEVRVVPYPFPEDRITVTPGQAASLDDPRAAEEALLLRRLRSQGGGPPLWDGPFGLPLRVDPLRITTQFGEIRYVNGRRTGQHSGLDLGAPEGTPVYAPAPGRVVLARELLLTGNTVLLDHGANLFSLYGHLSAIAVAEGDRVARGQVLGAVGSTGLSTGPHLHWSVYIGNVATDPTQAMTAALRPPPPPEFTPE